MLIKITCFDDNRSYQKIVNAEPVVIKGFEIFKFAVHKTTFIRGIAWEEGDGYSVTELSTGLSIRSGITPKQAIENTELFLSEKGKHRTLLQILKYQHHETA